MEETNNYLPELPLNGEIDLSPYRLSASEQYEEPHYLLEYNGTGFSPLGGIQAIAGQKKNGKTFVLAQLMSAILGTGSENMERMLPGLRLNDDTAEWLGKETTVLYVDTEMEKLNTAKVLRRVHWLCGWDMTIDNPRFTIITLRNVPSNMDRQDIVLKAIAQIKPTAVFIDGLRDIVRDFNDNDEASQIINKLMALASEINCCIWNVLHHNPKLGNDEDGKMRGHLGTELGNKVTDTFVSIKHKGASAVYFTVKQQDARGKDVDDWNFEISDDVGVLGIPRMISPTVEQATTKQKVDSTIEETRTALKEILCNGFSCDWRNLMYKLQEALGLSEATARKRLNKAKDLGIIKRLSNDFKWYYSESSEQNDEELAPSEDPVPF